jgi:hypothetical protein
VEDVDDFFSEPQKEMECYISDDEENRKQYEKCYISDEEDNRKQDEKQELECYISDEEEKKNQYEKQDDIIPYVENN